MDEAAKLAFGRRLEKAIKQSEYTAPTLAEKIGRTKPAVYKWQKGQAVPGLDAVLDICRVLKIRLEWLAMGSGSMKSSEPLSEAELDLLNVFRDMPHTAQDSAAAMLKIGRTLYFGGDVDRREAFQDSVTVHEESPDYSTE